jgi:predicted nucleic acid-binding protein
VDRFAALLAIASAYAAASAGPRLVNAWLCGELVPDISPALQKEYDSMLPRAIRGCDHEAAFQALRRRAVEVELPATPRMVPEDPEDDKLLALALATGADAVITNDRDLPALDPYGDTCILRLAEFVRLWLAAGPTTP